MEMGAMGTMGMVIRRGLGELGPFLFVFRRRAPVFGIQVRGLGDIVFLRALLDGLPLVLRRRNLGPLDPPTEDEEPITKEAPVKPDEDARGIIGLWFEGNVRARAYRKMGRA